MIIRFIALTKYKNMQYRQKSQSHYDMRLTFFPTAAVILSSHTGSLQYRAKKQVKPPPQNPASLQTNPVILTIGCIVRKEK